MEKVILVINKPKSCMFCPLIDGETGECKEGGIIEDNENPTYCPLKPLPIKTTNIEKAAHNDGLYYVEEISPTELKLDLIASIDEILEEIV